MLVFNYREIVVHKGVAYRFAASHDGLTAMLTGLNGGVFHVPYDELKSVGFYMGNV